MTMNTSGVSPVFQCLRCGNCCRHPGEVRLEHDEAQSIAAYLQQEILAFTSRYTRLRDDRHGLCLTDLPDGSCVFLEASPARAACRIQGAKPRQCQGFPLRWKYENLAAVCPACAAAHAPFSTGDQPLSMAPPHTHT